MANNNRTSFAFPIILLRTRIALQDSPASMGTVHTNTHRRDTARPLPLARFLTHDSSSCQAPRTRQAGPFSLPPHRQSWASGDLTSGTGLDLGCPVGHALPQDRCNMEQARREHAEMASLTQRTCKRCLDPATDCGGLSTDVADR